MLILSQPFPSVNVQLAELTESALTVQIVTGVFYERSNVLWPFALLPVKSGKTEKTIALFS